MDWIESSSWVIALHPNSTNISPELLTSTKLIDLRFISSPVQPMQLIFWLTVKCFIADRTSSMKIKRKNLINIPSCYFSYNSLLVHSLKKKGSDKYAKEYNGPHKSLPHIRSCPLYSIELSWGRSKIAKHGRESLHTFINAYGGYCLLKLISNLILLLLPLVEMTQLSISWSVTMHY